MTTITVNFLSLHQRITFDFSFLFLVSPEYNSIGPRNPPIAITLQNEDLRFKITPNTVTSQLTTPQPTK